MMIRRLVPIIAAVSLGFAVAVTWLLTPSSSVTAPPNQPAHSTLKEGRIAGLGIVEPRGECVAVGSAVPGIVDVVLVKPGDAVKEGQPLFKLEQAERQAEVEARMAALQLEESKLSRLEAQPRPEDVTPLEARVRAAEVEAKRAEGTFERVKTAREAGAASVEDLEQRRFAMLMAQAMVDQMKAELTRLKNGAWKPDLEVARREVASAKAALEKARVDLERLTVKSPTTGSVLKVDVRAGEYATAGRLDSAMVTVGDEGPLHVRVQVDEDDAARVKPGSPAEAFTRGRDPAHLALRFVRIDPRVEPKTSLRGIVTERVDTRVLVVVYEVVKTEGSVYVGQQVDVFIDGDAGAPAAPTAPTKS
jgi:multidrug resistance efflux pump